jgi:hypothetical protein
LLGVFLKSAPSASRAPAIHERSTTAPGIRLVPLETLDHKAYKPQAEHIKPPWEKEVYENPARDTS